MTEEDRRLAGLREVLAAAGLAGFVLPRADAHQSEYLPPAEERLAWLTGFTGSAGTAVVWADHAALFVDGRYTLEAHGQVDTDAYTVRHVIDDPPADWIAQTGRRGDRIGIDPTLHSERWIEKTRATLDAAGLELVRLTENPIDGLWPDRPPPPAAAVRPHPIRFAGQAASEKRAEIGAALAAAGADAAVLTAPESIAWLLNTRGGDVSHTPLALSFAVLHRDGQVDWYIEPARVGEAVRGHLGEAVSVVAPATFRQGLEALGRAGHAVLADPDTANGWVFDRLRAGGAVIVRKDDPCQIPKACKNDIELAGARAAHLTDGVAMVRFLAWLAAEAPGGAVTERAAADRLHAFRSRADDFDQESFRTISAAGPNAARPHYSVTEQSNRPLRDGDIYLVDSGGQYPSGTTDITRTVMIGTPDPALRAHFTLVLKGHIALDRVRFPAGTTGTQLDTLARLPLWQAGRDFDHGTGHGVGSYLGVHEGPQRITKTASSVALRPGMIISNEPGYYLEGAYGIRIENLLAVREAPDFGQDGRRFLEFECLTLAPIDRHLVALDLLSPAERTWLNDYHARVRTALSPHLDPPTCAWLEAATAAL